LSNSASTSMTTSSIDDRAGILPLWPPFAPRARLRGLYVITDARLGGGHLSIARAALAGGARIIQLRDKNTPLPELLPIARELRRLTRERQALFIVNDRADLAQCAAADGVHLGPDDLPVRAARQILGPHKIIGASCGTAAEAIAAWQAGADYVGCGAIFGTQTKSDAGDAIGPGTLRRVVSATPLPVAAIGGVNLDNIADTRAAGAAMAAVITAITKGGDEEGMVHATHVLIERFERGRYSSDPPAQGAPAGPSP
jgi:thiamine-phosphate diphosphorylase